MSSGKNTNRVKFMDEHMANFEHEVKFYRFRREFSLIYSVLELSAPSKAAEQERGLENHAI